MATFDYYVYRMLIHILITRISRIQDCLTGYTIVTHYFEAHPHLTLINTQTEDRLYACIGPVQPFCNIYATKMLPHAKPEPGLFYYDLGLKCSLFCLHTFFWSGLSAHSNDDTFEFEKLIQRTFTCQD